VVAASSPDKVKAERVQPATGWSRRRVRSRRSRRSRSDSDQVAVQLAHQPGRRTGAGLRVLVRRHLEGRHSSGTAAAAWVATIPPVDRCERP